MKQEKYHLPLIWVYVKNTSIKIVTKNKTRSIYSVNTRILTALRHWGYFELWSCVLTSEDAVVSQLGPYRGDNYLVDNVTKLKTRNVCFYLRLLNKPRDLDAVAGIYSQHFLKTTSNFGSPKFIAMQCVIANFSTTFYRKQINFSRIQWFEFC